MEKWLKDHNIVYDKVCSPSVHYVIKSELNRYDITDIDDAALYFSADNNVKVLIPNYSTSDIDEFITNTYPDVYFCPVYHTGAESIDTIYNEGDYGFFNSKK